MISFFMQTIFKLPRPLPQGNSGLLHLSRHHLTRMGSYTKFALMIKVNENKVENDRIEKINVEIRKMLSEKKTA